MLINKAHKILFVVVSLLLVGCKPKYRQQEQSVTTPVPDQETLYRSNQAMVRQNAKLIKNRAAEKGWKLTETGTGVFYQVYSVNKGANAVNIEPGDEVSLTYNLDLLDGTICYSSKGQGLKQFIVEKSDAEQGLHEVVQLLHKGDSALIVIPPNWAFGLAGDGNLIPPGAIIVYEIRVDSVVKSTKN
jgi:FKBP-type peptidyl-prolyl cis-trans isomerase